MRDRVFEMARLWTVVFLGLLCCCAGAVGAAGEGWDGKIVMPGEEEAVREPDPTQEGERWAVLVAGSAGYGNYRHQVG